MYIAHSLQPNAVHVQRSPLPPEQRPWDLLIRDGILYVLLDEPGETTHRIRVMASSDGVAWSEILAFEAPTFARSFELLNGDFYFGLGCEVQHWRDSTLAELAPETGTILRMRGSQFTLPTDLSKNSE